MTKAQRKQFRRLAAELRRKQEPLTREHMSFVLYYTHPMQHGGIGYAAQRGPGWLAEELERIVFADEANKTPAIVEAERTEKPS